MVLTEATGIRFDHSSGGDELLGREVELDIVKETLGQAERGRPSFLVVEGAAGMGKTRLLRAAGQLARRRGFDVTELTVKQVAELAESTFAHKPTLIAVDDVHAASKSELRTLWAEVSHRPGPPVWIMARRSGTMEEGLDRLTAHLPEEMELRRLALGPLCVEIQAALVAARFGAPPDAALRALVRGTAGHPLLLTALVDGLSEDDSVLVTDGVARLIRDQLPRYLRWAVQCQLADLSEAGRQLLRIAAMLGLTFSPDMLLRSAGEPLAHLLPALQEALDCGVLVDIRGDLAFAQPVTRRVIMESTPLAIRLVIAASTPQTGLSSPPPEATDMTQTERAPAVGGPRLQEALTIAARDALPNPQIAAALATRALDVTPRHDPSRTSVLALAVQAQAAAGRFGEAAVLTQSLINESNSASVAVEARYTLAVALILTGHAGGGREAEAINEPDSLPACLARLVHAAVLHGRWRTDSRAAAEYAREILPVERINGDPVALAALTILSTSAWDKGNLTEGMRLGREAVKLRHDCRSHPWQPLAQLSFAAKLGDVRQTAEAERWCDAAELEGKRLGLLPFQPLPPLVRARVLLQGGRLQEAVACAEKAVAAAQELEHWGFGLPAAAIQATAALRRGDLSTAEAAFEPFATDLTDADHAGDTSYARWVTLQVTAARHGSPEAALRLPQSRLADCPALAIREPGAAAWLARTALAAGNLDLATQVLTTVRDLAAGNPHHASVAVAAVHAGGVVERDPEALEYAVANHRDQWAAASAAEDLARLMSASPGASNRRRAVDGLRNALTGYEATGSLRDAARVEERLNGADRTSQGRRAGASDEGWDALSGIHRTIADLVSQGMTNREVAERMLLSPHTVDAHLRRIYRTLNINSRTQLAQRAARHLES